MGLKDWWHNFWGSSSAETTQKVQKANIGEEIRRLMHRGDVEQTMETAMPFVIGSLVTWPTYWLYRGYAWPSVRGKETLPLYIRKTFYQAKVMQFAVISVGVLYVLTLEPRRAHHVAA